MGGSRLMLLADHRAGWALPAALAAALLFLGIGNHAFWGDEADTAIFGRNVLLAGYPTGWDGRNLFAYRDGALLDRRLTEVQSPWLQYYVAAGSFALLGENTAAGRLPFALMGVATVAAFYFAALRWRESRRFAFACALALAVWVPFLLYARQCRYYAPAMLAAVVMFHLWLRLSLRRPRTFAAFVLAGVLFFHAQYLMFACFFAALFLADLLVERRRERLVALLVSAPAITLFTLPWVLALGAYNDPQARVFVNAHPYRWAELFWRHLRDYNTGGFFPVLLLVPLALGMAKALRRRRDAARMLVPAALVLAYTAVLSAASPQALNVTRFADVRYCVPMIPVLVLIAAECIRWIGRRSVIAAAAVVVLCFGTDLPGLGFLSPAYRAHLAHTSPFGLPFRCLVAEYVYENACDYETPTDAVINYLAEHSARDQSLAVYPAFMGAPELFYLGERLRFVSVLPPDDARLVPCIKGRLPEYVYTRVRPDWVVAFGPAGLALAARDLGIEPGRGYAVAALETYPSSETTRPEIFLRSFGPVRRLTPADRVYILRKQCD